MSRVASRWAGLGPFLITALVVYGAFRLWVRPRMVLEVTEVEQEVVRWKSRADGEGPGSFGVGAGEAAALEEELARTGERVTALAGILATSGESEAVLQSLGSMASSAGVRFLRFAPEPEFQLDGYLASAASVVAEGTFFDFLSFFERVSLSQHLVLIEDVTLEVAAGGLVRCRLVAVTVRAAVSEPATQPARSPISAAPHSDDAARGESGC